MLHISMKIGQTLTIDGTGYTLKGVDQLNSGANLITSNGTDEQDHWAYVGGDSIQIGDDAELAVHSIAPSFTQYAKFTLISNRIHDVTFPNH